MTHHKRPAGFFIFQGGGFHKRGVARQPCHPFTPILSGFIRNDIGNLGHFPRRELHDGKRVLREVEILLLVDFGLTRGLKQRLHRGKGIAAVGRESGL